MTLFVLIKLAALMCCLANAQQTTGFAGGSPPMPPPGSSQPPGPPPPNGPHPPPGGQPGQFPPPSADANRQAPVGPKRAVAVLGGAGNNTGVHGYVVFDQTMPGLPVQISGLISGLAPNSLHGFHIHNFGDIRNSCLSAGSHFNPSNETHGAPTDAVRHVGDLGNILADANGEAKITLVDTVITLGFSETCVIGRAVVLHDKVDDLGLGGSTDSKTTGNAGSRIACGVIGIANSTIV
ncbi:superoxide dismutase [Cu-Zn]-like [Paramacrobiotus metropolitanus]|uniref:superoxide dismutase [Cu-Zn]-like n=1 Tax=Paramacrobiotus metropolitanus TaxID=2943436 RepID=UPI002445D08B|nr:superoxide dismutase [Cu-Zn]-like [Paramacrobiotus metropolitanus]